MSAAPPPYSGPDAGAYPPGEPTKVAPGAMPPQQPAPGYGATPGYTGYPPSSGAPGYPTQAGTTTVVMQQPVVVNRVVMGPYPAFITCSQCHAQVTTTVSYQNGLMVWLMVGGMILVGLWLGCCLIPFCIDSVKDCTHACPNCHAIVGYYKRI